MIGVFGQGGSRGPQGPAGADGATGATGATGPAGIASYGTLVSSLSGNVTFTASETKTLATITPTNNRVTTYYCVIRAVPATNDGSGGGVFSEMFVHVRKSAGTVTVSASNFGANARVSPLNASTNDATASSGNVLFRFTTSGGAATVTRCDIYADEST